MESEYEGGSACCFCFSIKKNDVRRSKSGIERSKQGDWGKNEEMLSDLSTFSVEEQERRLKKAMEEEERVSREAEKIVQWVKQESARMDASAIKSIPSDRESEEAAPK